MDIRTHAQALLSGIYAIVNEAADCVDLARAAVEGGVRIIQYRAKGGIVPDHARALRAVTRSAGALFIINDDWMAAKAYAADGAHVGFDNLGAPDVAVIRSELGARVLGVSCATQAQAQTAQAAGADYLGVGSVYETGSKTDAGAPIGISGLKSIAQASLLPVAAIGGITLERLPEVRAAGVAMAAVLSEIARSSQPQAAARALVQAWNASP